MNQTTLAKPKAVLFDWDNTLADTWPTIYDALSRTFKQMGKEPWSFDTTKERVHRSLRDSFPEIFGERWQEAGDLYLSYFTEIHLEKFTPLQGAEAVLQEIQSKDIYMAVVSNKTGCNLRAEVAHIGWNKYFSKLVGAKDTECDKPSPIPVHVALEGSGVTAGEHVWFIGDSVTDMECAYNANCTPIFYGDQDLAHQRFRDYQPSIHVKDHDALIDVLNRFE